MRTVKTTAQLRAAVSAWHKAGETVALVPTMGALHAGHMALLAAARAAAGRTVVSIFVNPAQFGPTEDFARYPRRAEADAAMLAEAGCDLLFAPATEDIYPPGFATIVRVGGLGDVLDGASRPGHFDGVATVVARLLSLACADVAVFGEKDWQQLQIVRRLATDLALYTAIVGVPTMREPDGLALSSRNQYLSAAERAVAPSLHAALLEAADGARHARPDALAAARAHLETTGFRLDYLMLCDAETLTPKAQPPGRLLAAAWLGQTRLVDNVPV